MVKRLYADLNVFYLKLYQYEKILGTEVVDPLFDVVNADINDLMSKHDEELKQMSLTEMLRLSTLMNKMNFKSADHAQILLAEDYEIIKILKSYMN